MNSLQKLSVYLYVILMFFILVSCRDKKDNDDPEIIQLDKDINEFIYNGLRQYYLWNKDVYKLTDEYWNYSTQEAFDNAYNNFLSSTDDHETFFSNLLYRKDTVDKFSWIVDDYTVLEKQLEGKTVSMGYDFMLYRFSGSDNIFGIVRYVIKNSPADLAGLKRGDFFTKVNDEALNINNYSELLGETTSYTLSLASISGNSIISNGIKVNMTAVEIAENPIYIYKVLDVNSKKIGYLCYNGFYSDYDIELNNVFKYFQENNIEDLVLDLRYNPGGSLESAINLASMIYGTYTDKIFHKSVYNDGLQEYLNKEYGSDYFNSYFTDAIKDEDGTVLGNINTLNLQKVYIIATRSSASASEAIINGLSPYMDVVTIGTTTYGKYVGSMTIKDWDENGNVNPDHKWAMQPIVVKGSNAQGASDFYNGLAPDYELEEDISNLSELGSIYEPLLQFAIGKITGTGSDKSTHSDKNIIEIADSKDLVPFGKDMNVKVPGIKGF